MVGGKIAHKQVGGGMGGHNSKAQIWRPAPARKEENPSRSWGFLSERTTGLEPATLTLASTVGPTTGPGDSARSVA